MKSSPQTQLRRATSRLCTRVPRSDDTRHQALAQLEHAEGGRERLLDLLTHASELTSDEEAIVNALADPANDHIALGTVAARHGLSFNKVVALISKSDAAKALRDTRKRIFSKVPAVAEDVIDRAVIHTKDCPQCLGKKIMDCTFCPGTGITDKGNPCPRCKSEGKIECRRCAGAGTVKAYPDLKRQQLALSMVPGLLPQAGGNKQETHVNVAAQFNLPRNTVEFRAATDRLLFSHRAEEDPPVEAEVIPESEEQHSSVLKCRSSPPPIT